MKSKSIKRKHKPSKSISLDQFVAAYNAADAACEEANAKYFAAMEAYGAIAEELVNARRKLSERSKVLRQAQRAVDKAEYEMNAAKLLEDIQMASQK